MEEAASMTTRQQEQMATEAMTTRANGNSNRKQEQYNHSNNE